MEACFHHRMKTKKVIETFYLRIAKYELWDITEREKSKHFEL